MSKQTGREGKENGETRRDFLRNAKNYSVASIAGTAALMGTPREADATQNVTWAEHFQDH
ncbi:MAG: twin-arginine translocation signal domain-containing protein, partial [Gammaproteobacteria bacterium]|nr:twin-arginine translocation signal domain-containing protein [Gammaproteobacteria bacterium]